MTTAANETLPPLRALMGGAVGVASMAVTAAAAQEAPAPAGATTLEPVVVSGQGSGGGYQTNLPSLNRLTQPLLDTPQTINVVPRQLMDDQGISTVRDALRNVPGISLAAGEAGAQGDNLTIRGFSARNDFFLDGMRDFGSYYRDDFNLESIEVLKGPASVIFGRGSTGGVVNQVSKQPGLTPITAGTIQFGTDGTKRMTSDINRAIDAIPGAAIRLNLMVNENGTAERDVGKYRRFGVAPSLAFGLGTPTRLFIDYFHQQSDDIPDYGLPWFYSSPASVPRQTFYGYKNSDYLRTNVNVGTVKLEHDFSDKIQFRDQFRYGNYERSIRVTEPQIQYTKGVNQFTALNVLTVLRNQIAVTSTETLVQNQADMNWKFDTGPLNHTLVTGIEVGKEISAPIRSTYALFPGQLTSLLWPNSNDIFKGVGKISTNSSTSVTTVAPYFVDTIKWGEHWELSGGIRFDYMYTSYQQTVAPATYLNRTDAMPSYRVALSYKPVPEGSIYVAYGTSFNPSSESLSLATSSAGLAPEENETYELGVKWEVLNRKLTLNAAVFQLEKTNARVTDPNNSLYSILGGDQRVRGFESGVMGNLTDNWTVSGGFAYLNSKVVSTTLANTVGEPLANTPRWSGSLFTTYKLPWHDIVIGGGFNAMSSRLASSSPNSTTGAYLKAPGYGTFQLMARMPVHEGVDLQFNANNITNQKFYDLLHPSHVVPGAGRALLASINVKL